MHIKGILIDVDEEPKPVLKHGHLILEELESNSDRFLSEIGKTDIAKFIKAVKVEFEESRVEFEDFDCYFSRTFFNAHTHLADAVAKDPNFDELVKLVAPGGFKHRILSSADLKLVRKSIEGEVEAAKEAGTVNFLDFREGGIEGLRAVEGIEGVFPLARPRTVEEAEMMDAIGFGMSSVRDHDFPLLEELRKMAEKREMIFAIHAGEKDCDDVEKALTLEPDLIIHMNACPEKIKDVMDMQIPVVSCPKSNAFFELMNKRSYEILAEYDLWMLGSDNAMVSKPSILEEMHFLSYILRKDVEVLKAALRGNEIFNRFFHFPEGYIVFNRKRNFRNTLNPLSTLVRRAGCEDIEFVAISE